ncbi:hypothetical protein AM593_07863, partial [Mytilus galloprovincialis]
LMGMVIFMMYSVHLTTKNLTEDGTSNGNLIINFMTLMSHVFFIVMLRPIVMCSISNILLLMV